MWNILARTRCQKHITDYIMCNEIGLYPEVEPNRLIIVMMEHREREYLKQDNN